MNKNLIEKVITANNEKCPDIIYKNPVLDRCVARALSRSFLKILQLPSINNNLSYTIIDNIRNMCRIEPDKHLKMDHNTTKLIVEMYEKHLSETLTEQSYTEENLNKQLDSFLVHKMKSMDIATNIKSSTNPEVVQALINLNGNNDIMGSISKDLLHWDASKPSCSGFLKNMWTENSTFEICNQFKLYDNISLKMKSEIELTVLALSLDVIQNRFSDIENNTSLKNVINNCSKSPNCFQTCSAILNALFVTNFDPQLSKFISTFVKLVKDNCTNTIAVLYPADLCNIIVLLDFDVNILPIQLKEAYIDRTLHELKRLHRESENDLIMLLSHFPTWFDIYFY